jgi:hypothetical protein
VFEVHLIYVVARAAVVRPKQSHIRNKIFLERRDCFPRGRFAVVATLLAATSLIQSHPAKECCCIQPVECLA